MDLDPTKPMSPSSTGNLLNCSEQWRLERVVEAPQREAWASVGGTCVHLMTESLDRQRFAATGV